MLPAGQAAGEAFYRVVDAAYERRSVAVTSNLHPSGFDTIMPKTIATAAVDRLLHHAHVVITEGTSLRLTDATNGKGVMPLGLTPQGDQAVRAQGDHVSADKDITCPPTGICRLSVDHGLRSTVHANRRPQPAGTPPGGIAVS
jgi:hypothetical protein